MRGGIVCLTMVSLLALARFAPGQTTYTYDNGAGGLTWSLAGNWDPDVGGAGTGPGSLLNGSGATNDIVRIFNDSFTAGSTVDLDSVDAGTIGSLQIGGGSLDHATTLRLEVGGARLTISGDVTLGAVGGTGGTTQLLGNLNVGNNTAANVTILGNILSGSTADNDVVVNGSGGVNGLTLGGNIDMAGVNRIDVTIQRGVLNWTGAEMHVQEFNVVDASNANVTSSWTLNPGQLLEASVRSDIGRNGSTATQGSKTTDGTLNIFGTATFTAADALVLGNTGGNANSTNMHQATGTVNVGDATRPGTLVVQGEIRLGPGQDGANNRSTGNLVIDNAGSVVTLQGGIEMAANSTANALQTANVTIHNGLVTIYKHVEDGSGTSTINLNGGTLHLATPFPTGKVVNRGVDNLNFAGGVLRFTHAGRGGLTKFDGGAVVLSTTPGGSQFDLVPESVAPLVDTSTRIEWVGNTGAWDASPVGKWDANPAAGNQMQYILPSQGAQALYGGLTFTLVEETGDDLSIANRANAALTAASDVDWDLDLTDAGKVKAVFSGGVSGRGAATAVIDGAASVVTRTGDLLIAPDNALAPDAAALEVSNSGSLTVSNNLVINGNSATDSTVQEVLLAGGTLNVNNHLVFGGSAGAPGGIFRMTGGTLNVAGSVVEGLADGTPDANVQSAQFFVDADLDNAYGGGDQGNLTVGGEIVVQSFRLADNVGSVGSFTLGLGKSLTTTGTLGPGDAGNGTLVNNGGTISADNFQIARRGTGNGVFTQLAGTTTVTGSGGTDVGVAAGSVGALNITGGEFRGLGDGIIGALNATASSAITVGGSGLNPLVVTQGDNLTVALSGAGTFAMRDGTILLNSNNLLVAANAGAAGTAAVHGGTIDMRGEAKTHTGQLVLANSGTGSFTIHGGTMVIANDINGGNAGSGAGSYTQNGGDVFVRRDLVTRSGSSAADTIHLAGGNLIFGNALGLFQGVDETNDLDFAGSGDVFHWTGGTLGGVDNVVGVANLGDTGAGDAGVFHQKGGMFIVVGGMPTTINGHYAIDGGATINANFIASAPGAALIIDNAATATATATFHSASTNYNLAVNVVDAGDTSDANAATWTAGASTWDTTKSKWDINRLPAAGKLLASGTEFTVVDSRNTLGGTPSNVNVVGPWTAATKSVDGTNDDLVVTSTAPVEYGAVKAILGGASNVTRNGDLRIYAGLNPLTPADAAALELRGGTSRLTITGDLNLGGAAAAGSVVQNGDVSVGGDLVFGPADTDWPFGGSYTINGGKLTVTGQIAASANLSNQATLADKALLAVDVVEDAGNGLAVGGNISVQDFHVGSAEGKTGSWTLPDGKTLSAAADVSLGHFGTGTLNVGGGGSGGAVQVGGDLVLGSQTPTTGSSSGTLNVRAHSTVTVGDDMFIGLSAANDPAGGSGHAAVGAGGLLDIGDQIRMGAGTFTLDGGTVRTGGTVAISDGDGDNALVDIKSGTLNVGSILYFGDDDVAETAVTTVNVGAGGGAPTITSAGLRVGQHSTANVTMDSGTVTTSAAFQLGVAAPTAAPAIAGAMTINGGSLTVTSGGIQVGVNAEGTLVINDGTVTFTGETRIGDNASGVGTLILGNTTGGNPTVYANGQTELPEDGSAVFKIYSGVWYQNDGNFVQSQTTGTGRSSRVEIHGGTLDLTGDTGTHTGQWNINIGQNDADILGGLVRIGGALQLTDATADRMTMNIGDGTSNPTVQVGVNLTNGDGINYRPNGNDTINLKSGTLDLNGLRISNAGNAINGTNHQFNWTGGTLRNVGSYVGNLTQSSTDAPSRLVIGNSPGTMNVTGNYTVTGSESDVEFELGLPGNAGGAAGSEWDLLAVTGTATFDDGSQIVLAPHGHSVSAGDWWDIVDAATIAVGPAYAGDIAALFDTSLFAPQILWDFQYFLAGGNGYAPGTILVGNVVPEPSGLLLALLALAGLLARRRWR